MGASEKHAAAYHPGDGPGARTPPPTREPEGECIAAVWVSDEMAPCGWPATGWAHDPEDADIHPAGGWFPACDEHREETGRG